jgi:hypothetical protein
VIGRISAGTALLVVVLCFAVWKTSSSVRGVLGRGADPTVSASADSARATTKEGDLIARLHVNDSLLAALTPSAVPPSPFSPRVVIDPNPRPRPAPRDTTPPVEIPRVLLATVDAQSPEVVLGASGGQSSRLRVGSVWQGWTVLEISKSGVAIEGHGQTARLPVPGT